MKHHPKSNNGVFSKRQLKASRMMIHNMFKPTEQMGLKARAERNSIGTVLANLIKSKLRRKAS